MHGSSPLLGTKYKGLLKREPFIFVVYLYEQHRTDSSRQEVEYLIAPVFEIYSLNRTCYISETRSLVRRAFESHHHSART